LTDAIEQYAKQLSTDFVLSRLEGIVRLNFWQRFWIRRGKQLPKKSIESLAKKSEIAGDTMSIIQNCTAIAAGLITLFG
jgi:hypothetical protein